MADEGAWEAAKTADGHVGDSFDVVDDIIVTLQSSKFDFLLVGLHDDADRLHRDATRRGIVVKADRGGAGARSEERGPRAEASKDAWIRALNEMWPDEGHDRERN